MFGLWKKKRIKRPYSEFEDEIIKKMRENKYSWRTISKELNRDFTSVYQHGKRLGL